MCKGDCGFVDKFVIFYGNVEIFYVYIFCYSFFINIIMIYYDSRYVYISCFSSSYVGLIIGLF